MTTSHADILEIDLATGNLLAQLEHRVSTAVICGTHELWSSRGRAALHAATQHLVPGGTLIVDDDDTAVALAIEFEFVPVLSDDSMRRTFHRTDRTTVHDLLHAARAAIDRLTPEELVEQLSGPLPPRVLDTRTPTDRSRSGCIPGSAHVPRTVLEWHLDPANGYPLGVSFDQRLVVVCDGGYSSSLAAANLRRIGFERASDLVGGFRAWAAAGLPVVAPDHTHLDISI